MERVRNIVASNGNINSVYPCYAYLTFGQWIYLVPQYDAESVLMLGYAGGTVAGLIRMFYGDIPITAVDINEPDEDLYNVNFVQADAREYIKTCDYFDTIIVDVFPDGNSKPCDFIFTKEFSDNIRTKGNYLIFNVDKDSDMSVYNDIHLVKVLSLDTSRFYYYMPKRVARLPIR